MRHSKGYITRQAKRLKDGEINRRRFVMSALSAGVTMPTALSLATRAEARTPRKGGLLRIATGDAAATDRLAPDAATNAFTRLSAFTRGNALTEILPDGTVTGELAAAISSSADGITWVLDLREGIRFHDGSPLLSSDVQATLAAQWNLLPGLSEIRADGPGKVVLTLSHADPDLPRRLADPRLIVLPSSGDAHIGTGPYKLEQFEPGQVARFTRNEDYWKPGRAHVDAVELFALPDLSARQRAIMAGEVDFADGIDPRALALLMRTPDIEVLEVAAGRHIALIAHAPGDQTFNELRQALPYQEMLDQILLGHGVRGDEPVGDLLSARPDVSRPIRLSVEDTGVPRTMEAARLIAARLTERGMPVELISTEDPDQTRAAHAHVCWRRSGHAGENGQDPALIAVWANDISAHSSKLTHTGLIGTNLENDGARLTERWWFA